MNRVTALFPELQDVVGTTMDQDTVKQKIQGLADSIPDTQKTATDYPLPTGIDKSIVSMLPDPIYIPAVKDLADDIKTTESTPFGKILAILLQAVEPKLPDAQELFDELNSKLNRVYLPDGTIVDRRLDEVKLIESTVEGYVRESFSDVDLRITIPPPELKTVFSSARIYANDGVDGPIDSKGDGLRRAIIFSILRSYVELKVRLAPPSTSPEEATLAAEATQPQVQPSPATYLLLFEEPELFLHPKAQHILFDALKIFAKEHHVLVTTHSPMFFGPGATETFVKLRKVYDAAIASKPFTQVQPVDLSNMNAKDQFQVICFENNNAAFFADTVILVEGDSDYLVMPHIARTLNPSWDAAKKPFIFARITGKCNIRRYRHFFGRFGIRVPVIADLDLLIDGFEQVEPDDTVKTARDKLLEKVDALIVPDTDGPTTKDAKDAHESGELRGRYRRFLQRQSDFKAGKCTIDDLDQAAKAFFEWQRKSDRFAVLKDSRDSQLLELKWKLLEMLRVTDIYVLERGALEDYYPDTIIGADKPSRAQTFCAEVANCQEILNCCGEQEFERDGSRTKEKEFNLIFQRIFGGQQ